MYMAGLIVGATAKMMRPQVYLEISSEGIATATSMTRKAPGMSRRKPTDYAAVRQELHVALEPYFPGIEIDVDYSERWQRTCLTFRHERFANWLTEQRFRNLVRCIPPKLFEGTLRGAVWFELAPGESVQDALDSKRSDDVADIEAEVFEKLKAGNFFGRLARAIARMPDDDCNWTFDRTRQVLDKMRVRGQAQDDVCLVFIRHGAHCDMEVLLEANHSLAEVYP